MNPIRKTQAQVLVPEDGLFALSLPSVTYRDHEETAAATKQCRCCGGDELHMLRKPSLRSVQLTKHTLFMCCQLLSEKENN